MLRVTTATLLGPLSLGVQKKPELAHLPSKLKVMGTSPPSLISDLGTCAVPSHVPGSENWTRMISREAWGPEGIWAPALDDTGGDKALRGDKPGESS